MTFLLAPIAIAAGVASLVCWVIVLIKMFPASVITGICGLVCPLYALYWGASNQDAQGLRKVMLIWGIAIVINLLMRFVFKAY